MYSYFFSVFSFLAFVAVGLDNYLKPLLFSPASARTFFVSSFHLIPQSKMVLFLRVAYRLTVGSLLFSISVFKIIPGLCSVCFFSLQFWFDKVSLFVSNAFFGLDTGTVFFANNFYIFKQHSVFNSKQSVFYLQQH